MAQYLCCLFINASWFRNVWIFRVEVSKVQHVQQCALTLVLLYVHFTCHNWTLTWFYELWSAEQQRNPKHSFYIFINIIIVVVVFWCWTFCFVFIGCSCIDDDSHVFYGGFADTFHVSAVCGYWIDFVLHCFWSVCVFVCVNWKTSGAFID